MSALAVRTGSVNLGQGFPDVDGPPEVIAGRCARSRAAPTSTPPASACPRCARRSPGTSSATTGSSSTPTPRSSSPPGCTEGIAAALLGLVDPGDEVVVLEPYYDSYIAMIQMAGGVRRPVTLRGPDFRLDVDELRAAVTPRTRFVLLNSPHNPTGTVLTRAELQAVADLAIEHDLVVITDEVYEHLTFDGREHVPIATLPGMFERTLTLSSAGKSYSFTGWKVGWATGPRRARRRRAGRQAVADLHLRARRCSRPSRCALDEEPDFPARAGRRPAGAARPARAPGCAEVGLAAVVPQGTYFASTRRRATSAGRTAWRSAWPCPSGPAWSRSRPRASTTPTAAEPPAPPGPVGVLQAAAT